MEGLRRGGALDQLNALLLVLQSPPEPPPSLTRATIGLQLWRELADGLVLEATGLRQTLGMPEVRTWLEILPEPQEESSTKIKKEKPEKKGAPPPKEEKKGAGGREDKKGTPRSTPVKDKPADVRNMIC
ncbi:MYCBP-associated protein-like [Clupea harengus]|uniref:MYCBP-associated protein-like n=1 Tax=Clupea harengus TaxID=7950 RepID=A0A8M1KDE3_CLUHA|nr:MYCBP-associated protein-like [Clupea harengus]